MRMNTSTHNNFTDKINFSKPCKHQTDMLKVIMPVANSENFVPLRLLAIHS